jgi:hypothetical protein
VIDFVRGCRPRLLTLILPASVYFLLLPATASATTFAVDSVGTQSDDASNGVCATPTNACTLPAAIEESNASTDVRDEITFAGSFDSGPEDVIMLSSELPPITDPVTIDAKVASNDCSSLTFRPCAGIDGPEEGAALQVKADEVTIEGLSITGATQGIAVLDSADDFSAGRNWIGVAMDGSAAGNSTGIFLGPGANQAEIGGFVNGASEKNLIANNGQTGLDLEGASGARISNNDFGIFGLAAAPNGKNIEITDSERASTIKAVNNEVGAEVFPFGSQVTHCEGGCNLISGAMSLGIDLQGDGGVERPAAGPTRIRSNFIGTDYTGETSIGNGSTAVLVGEADHVTIGGTLEKDANWISGGEWGVRAGPNARYLVIESNFIGLSDQSSVAPPSAGGISVDSAGILFPEGLAQVSANSVQLKGGVGIEALNSGARISENGVYATDLGIRVHGENAFFGSLVADNDLEGNGTVGVLIETSKNRVIGNYIYGQEKAGIEVAGEVRENVIGGDEEEDENAIFASDGPAIEVAEGASFIDVLRNWGADNGGLFIDLGGDEIGNATSGPNGAVQAPVIESATTNGASGKASPFGSFVRVFLKSDSSPGEIDSFLGSAVVEGGEWSVEYPEPIPPGTWIAVSQTVYEGTSELALAETAPAESAPAAPRSCSFFGNCPSPAAAGGARDSASPATKILTGPPRRSAAERAVFKFASEPDVIFECKLDKGKFKSCKSPKTYKKLKVGKHVFKVRATDKAGNVGKPAKRKFTVLAG